ncbi:MAG: FAD-dependent oxidoreductase [Eubacteriales bacterium]|nr:FAD-dependent oxidoreductase [Eubacteriales bacterium]
MKYDLIVIGGGFSGVAAALAGARGGAKVLLVEKSNCLGGAAANCLVNPFMPYWTHTDDTRKERIFLSKGIFEEIVNNLKDANATDKLGMVFDEEYTKLLLNRMVLKEGIQILYHSQLIGSNVENGKVVSVNVANKSGIMTLEADYFVDATGDGDLAAMSGCPFHLGREEDNLCQPMTLCFRVANVDVDRYSPKQTNILYKEFQKQGKIKNIREDVLTFKNMVDGVIHFNSTRVVKLNPIDAFDITKAEIEAREQVFELVNFMKENCDGFENAQLVSTAMSIGVRESRMMDGEYLLTSEDLVACKKFEDSIAIGNYDIDIHNPEGSGTSHYYFPENCYYTIPYRSLQPKGVDNLLNVGRCLSSTHEAQASYRIMPICCCTGQAAGTAIAIAVKDKVSCKEVDINKLQTTLKNNGALI